MVIWYLAISPDHCLLMCHCLEDIATAIGKILQDYLKVAKNIVGKIFSLTFWPEGLLYDEEVMVTRDKNKPIKWLLDYVIIAQHT